MTTTPVLSVVKLNKSLGDRKILSDVTFDIRERESFAVFGPPGCGKTMLAAVVCGAMPPDEGEVRLNVSSLSVAREQSSLARDLTLQENYEMFAALGGLHRKRRSGRIAAVIEELGLSQYRGRLAGELSWQMLRLAEIGKALLPDAELILVDSVLDSLPSEWLEAAWSALSERRRERAVSLLITTYDDKVAGLCERVALMHEGKILRCGSPGELRSLAADELVLIEPILSPTLTRKIGERGGFAIEEREDGIYVGARPNNEGLARLLAEHGGIGCVRLKKATLAGAIKALLENPK